MSRHDFDIDSLGETGKPKLVVTVSALAFNFDRVSSDSDKSRADEIRVLTVKNRYQRGEGKPPGIGWPGGQTESKETIIGALERETRDESSYPIRTVIGHLFTLHKHWVPNDIHLYLVEVHDYPTKVKEFREINEQYDPWSLTLRDLFTMPLAQDRNGENKNPDGLYFQHRLRLFWCLDAMLLNPDSLEDGAKIKKWVEPHRDCLLSAMRDLLQDGILDNFVPEDEPQDQEDQFVTF